MAISYRQRGKKKTWDYRIFDKNKVVVASNSGFKTKKEAEEAGIKAYNEYSVPAIFQAVTPISMLKSKMVSFFKFKKKKSQKDGQSFIKSPANLKVYN